MTVIDLTPEALAERQCFLCMIDGRPMTVEHVMPLWLSDFLRPKVGPEGLSWWTSEGRVFADRWDWTLPVCKPCNQWLNDRIETPAKTLVKQLLLGARSLTQLSRTQQSYIASWVFKTNMMVGRYKGTSLCPADETEFFYVHGVPSTHTAVWIGQLSDTHMAKPRVKNLAPKFGSDLEWMVPDVAWAPMHVVYQWFTIVLHKPSDTAWPVDLPVEIQSCFARIWPPREDVIDWPPPIVIDRLTHEAIVSMRGFHVPSTGQPREA